MKQPCEMRANVTARTTTRQRPRRGSPASGLAIDNPFSLGRLETDYLQIASRLRRRAVYPGESIDPIPIPPERLVIVDVRP